MRRVRRGTPLAVLLGLAVAVQVALPLADGLASQADAVPLEDYRAALARAERAAATDDVAAARAALATVPAVRLRGGEAVAPAPLLPEGTDAAAARQRLGLMGAQLALSDRDDSQVRLDRLRAVLARREFAAIFAGPSLWERFLMWLRDLVRRSPAPEGLPGAVGLAEGLGWLVVVGGGVALIVLLGVWVQGLLRSFVAEAGARRAGGEEEPATAAEARQQATALAQVGSYRLAVRHLYLSALLSLEERGLLRRDRGLTNREYLTQAAAAPAVREHLRPVVQTFDEVWYGVREPDQATFERYRAEVDRLLETRS